MLAQTANNLDAWTPTIACVFIVITALVIAWLILREKRRLDARDRFDRQQCVHCGYDLRASDGRCPECGFPIQPPELPLTMPLDRRTIAHEWSPDVLEPRQPGSDESLVEVYTSNDPMAVDLLGQQLEARGVRTSVTTKKTAGIDPISATNFERIYKNLSVWSGDLNRAIEIIHGLSSVSVARRSEMGV